MPEHRIVIFYTIYTLVTISHPHRPCARGLDIL